MSKSIKFTNDTYLDSSGVVFEKELLNELLTYSRKEKIIGKWIDGKPIYRKVLSGTRSSIGSYLTQSVIGYETVTRAYGIMQSIWGQWWFFPQYFTDSGYYISTYYTTAKITIEQGSNYNDDSSIIFIIEYTKITD